MTLGARRAFLAGGGAMGAAALALGAAAGAQARPAPRGMVLLATYVAGTGYHDAPAAAPRLRAGDALVLRRRPDSAYDPRTVEVWTTDGAKLGHVPRIDNQALARLLDAGVAATAAVSSVKLGPRRPEIGLEVSVAIAA
jgi:hypothetical protein